MIYKKFRIANIGLEGVRELSIDLDRNHGTLSLHSSNQESEFYFRPETGSGTMILNHRRIPVAWAYEREKLHLNIGGRTYVFSELSSMGAEEDQEISGEFRIRSRMPGKVLKVLVNTGQMVQKGDDIVVMESMKMESKIHAPCTGEVAELYIQEGDLVQADQELCQIKSES